MLRLFLICQLFSLFLISCKNQQPIVALKPTAVPINNFPLKSQVNAKLLVSGTYHSCASTDEGVKCWGDNSFGQLNVPSSVKDPSELIAGNTATCAIQNKKIICWGNNGLSSQLYPNLGFLQNPTKLTTADPGAEGCNSGGQDGLYCWDIGMPSCAVTDVGVKCWSGFMKDKSINIQNVDQIIATRFHLCILSHGSVECWSDRYNEINFFNGMKNVKQIALGLYSYCALIDSKAICIDDFETHEQQPYEVILNNPKQIQIGGRFICALDSDGVKCWGDKSSEALKVPELKNPKMISVGGTHVCAIDDTGIVCWGNKKLINPNNYFKPVEHDQRLQDACGYGSSNCIKNNLKYVYSHTTSLSKVIYSNDFYEGRDNGYVPLPIRSFKAMAVPSESEDLELELCQFVQEVQKTKPRKIYGNFFLFAKASGVPSCNLNNYSSVEKIKSLGYISANPQPGLQPLYILDAIWASSKYLIYSVGDSEKFDQRKYQMVGILGYVVPIE